MKRIAALCLLLAGMLFALPAHSQEITCRSTALYDASTNGSTVLVTGVTTSNIYVCGFNLFGAGTATVKLVYGTGTTCGTGETAITPAYSLVAQAGVADGSPIYRGLLVPAGRDLCIKTSAGVAIQAQIYFAQR